MEDDNFTKFTGSARRPAHIRLFCQPDGIRARERLARYAHGQLAARFHHAIRARVVIIQLDRLRLDLVAIIPTTCVPAETASIEHGAFCGFIPVKGGTGKSELLT